MNFGPMSVMFLGLLVIMVVGTIKRDMAIKERLAQLESNVYFRPRIDADLKRIKERLARLESKVGKILEHLDIDVDGLQ